MSHGSKILNKLIGLPYKLGGRDFSGADCFGIAWLYLKEQGIDLPESDGLIVDQTWKDNAEQRFINYLNEYAVKVDIPQKSDFVLIHCYRQMAHIGVMIDSKRMLHITADITSEICPVNIFGHRIVGFWRAVE